MTVVSSTDSHTNTGSATQFRRLIGPLDQSARPKHHHFDPRKRTAWVADIKSESWPGSISDSMANLPIGMRGRLRQICSGEQKDRPYPALGLLTPLGSWRSVLVSHSLAFGGGFGARGEKAPWLRSTSIKLFC